MADEGLGLYPIHDPEMPEVVEALQAHIERLGHTYAHDAGLDPMEGAARISQASDIYQRLTESLALLQQSGRVPAYSEETRRKMLLKQVADWERFQKGGAGLNINYKDPRWQKRRLEIMERDGWKCVACGDKHNELHVHHKRYRGELWEAEDDDLQTLCQLCHEELGPHPKAGIWYEQIEDYDFCQLVIAWCPLCGHNTWKDKGGYDKCVSGHCENWRPPFPDVCEGAMSYRCERMQKGGR